MSICNSDYVIVNSSDKNLAFDNLVKTNKNKPLIAFFHSPTCGHCVDLKKYFDSYRKKCKNELVIIYIDVTDQSNDTLVNKKIKREEGVPQVLVFENGNRVDHFVGSDPYKLANAFRRANLSL